MNEAIAKLNVVIAELNLVTARLASNAPPASLAGLLDQAKLDLAEATAEHYRSESDLQATRINGGEIS